MGTRSRRKGANFERETAKVLQSLWPEAKRGIGQTRAGSEVADVEGTPWWVECKRQKRCRIRAAYDQAVEATDGRPPLVITKDDQHTTLVTMTLEDFLEWAGGQKNSTTSSTT